MMNTDASLISKERGKRKREDAAANTLLGLIQPPPGALTQLHCKIEEGTAEDAASLDRVPRCDLQFLRGQNSRIAGGDDVGGVLHARDGAACAADVTIHGTLGTRSR